MLKSAIIQYTASKVCSSESFYLINKRTEVINSKKNRNQEACKVEKKLWITLDRGVTLTK